MQKYTTFDEIRDNWVNGNRKDAKILLTSLPTRQLLLIIAEFLESTEDRSTLSNLLNYCRNTD